MNCGRADMMELELFFNYRVSHSSFSLDGGHCSIQIGSLDWQSRQGVLHLTAVLTTEGILGAGTYIF